MLDVDTRCSRRCCALFAGLSAPLFPAVPPLFRITADSGQDIDPEDEIPLTSPMEKISGQNSGKQR
jgi:hypothetical protein